MSCLSVAAEKCSDKPKSQSYVEGMTQALVGDTFDLVCGSAADFDHKSGQCLELFNDELPFLERGDKVGVSPLPSALKIIERQFKKKTLKFVPEGEASGDQGDDELIAKNPEGNDDA